MLGGFRILLRFRFLGVGIRSIHNRLICGFRGFWLHSDLDGLGRLGLR